MKALLIALFIVSTLFSQNFIGRQENFSKESLMGSQTAYGLSNPTRGLLDPNRFSMNQSYSMSYASNGQNSDMSGLYLNRLQYDFQLPLTLQVDVGLFHKPMALMGRDDTPLGVKSSVLTVPHAALIYQPTDNFIMAFEYFNTPAGYSLTSMPSSLFEPGLPFQSKSQAAPSSKRK